MALTAKQLAAWHKRQGAAKPKTLLEKLSQKPADGFKPFAAATRAPSGSYDPAYDAQVENANQGFLWAGQDYDTSKLRLGNDYASAQDRQGSDYGTAKGYLAADRSQSLGDLLTSRNRGLEDYGLARDNLHRNYTDLGTSQTERARSAGVAEGGALAQAMMKRQANEARDQAGMDTQNSRFLQDNASSQGRVNDSFNRQNTALDTSNTRATQDLNQNYLRQNTDADTGFERSGIQNETFGRQINTQELGIAAANGALPTRPENEHTFKGITYQNETHNGKKYRRLPNGRLVPVTQKLASAV